MSKPGKSLKALCKRLKVRLTVKRGKKRVYKSIKVLKDQCKRKQKKKKKKVKRRRRKFGASLVTNNTTDTSWIAPGQRLNNIKVVQGYPREGTKFYIKYKGAPLPGTRQMDDVILGSEPINFSGINWYSPERYSRALGRISEGQIRDYFMISLRITECHRRPELVGLLVDIYNTRDQISLYPIKPLPYLKDVRKYKKVPSLFMLSLFNLPDEDKDWLRNNYDDKHITRWF